MTQNRNFSGTLNLSDKFVTPTWNHQIYYIIKLKDEMQIPTLAQGASQVN